LSILIIHIRRILYKKFESSSGNPILDKNLTAMKKSIFCLIIFTFSFLKINAQEISEKENSLLDSFINSKVSTSKEKIVSDTLEKVFNGTFFNVHVGFSFGDAGSQLFLFVIRDGKGIEYVSSSDSLNTLLSLVKKDFFLRNNADAKIFETCLDKLFPISWTSAGDKEHLKIDGKWYFVRGKFFDSKSGYIVTLDNNSKISDIAYSMEAIKK
jgi:hypothetical protein